MTDLVAIWAASDVAISGILATASRKLSGNINYDRVCVAIIYYNSGMLNATDIMTVQHPKFNDYLSMDVSLSDGIRALNRGLVQHFVKLAQMEGDNGEKYKAKAFNNAALSISSCPYGLSTLEQVQDYLGIKKKDSSTYIEAREYLLTGTSPRRKALETKLSVQDDRKSTIELFKGIHGIGDKIAENLYEQGYRTLDDLRSAPLTSAQTIGLQYYTEFKQRIPRSEIDEYMHVLRLYLPANNGWLIAGSYRRGATSSGDIDILFRNDTSLTMTTIVDALTRSGIVVGILANGSKKFMGAVCLGPGRITRRLDIRLFEPKVWPYALLYNTGSQQFNILCRQRAIDLGMRLNEYELVGAPRIAITEQDIFDLLGIQYLNPEQRTDTLTSLT